jgi:putative inorganic carbon (HCO3(-)) transporter
MVERVVLWDRAVDVIKARPWLGTGINTYAVAHQQFDTEKSWRVQNYYAHNSFLQLAADRGVPALLFFLVFLVLFFRQCFSVIRKSGDAEQRSLVQGVMAGLFGLLALSLVDTVFEPLQTGMLLWFLFGLGFAAIYVDSQRKES